MVTFIGTVLCVLLLAGPAVSGPAAPVVLAVTNPGASGKLTLSWSAVVDPALKEYVVYRSTASGDRAQKSAVAVVPVPGTALTDVGLTDGTPYFYQVTARDLLLSESPASSETSGTPTSLVVSVLVDPAAPGGTSLLSDGAAFAFPHGAVAGASGVGVSADPLARPLLVNPDAAKAASAGLATDWPGAGILAGTLREAAGLDGAGRPVTASLTKSITVTLPYAPGTVSPRGETRLALYWLDEPHRTWVRAPTSRADPAQRTVSAEMTRLTAYGIGLAPLTDLTEARAYPVPFTPGRDPAQTAVIFTGLTGRATVRIYTPRGDLVATLQDVNLDGQESWPATAADGNPASSGVYLYVIENAEQRKTGKLVILR